MPGHPQTVICTYAHKPTYVIWVKVEVPGPRLTKPCTYYSCTYICGLAKGRGARPPAPRKKLSQAAGRSSEAGAKREARIKQRMEENQADVGAHALQVGGDYGVCRAKAKS